MPVLPSEAIKWAKLHRTHLKGDIAKEYWKDVEKDFQQILPYLPEQVDSIVDIGCGLAGIDVLLAWHYPYARVVLLDGDGPEENFRGGFKETMEPFNNRSVVNGIFRKNGLPQPDWIDVGETRILQFDLIISLLSWGFHYPLETYHTSGLNIADIRKPHEAKGLVIAETPKYRRCLWRS